MCELRRMPRHLRQDYPGATHHVFVRGVARTAVAVDAADYERALTLLERAVSRFELQCHAWCYLPNHSHLLVTSRLGNLSRAMHWLGTCTAQSFNQRHARVGHLYQGRFGSRLVADERYLLELARYLPLNPVRNGLCDAPGDWPWSSYGATAGLRERPGFLDSGELLSLLGSRRRIRSLGRGWSTRDIPGRTRRSLAGTTAPDQRSSAMTPTKRSQPRISGTATALPPSRGISA